MKTFALALAATLTNASLLTHVSEDQAACRCIDAIPDITIYESPNSELEDFTIVYYTGMEGLIY